MEVSWNRGTPGSSILVGFSLINHPFGGTPIYGNPHIVSWFWPTLKHIETYWKIWKHWDPTNQHFGSPTISKKIREDFGSPGPSPQQEGAAPSAASPVVLCPSRLSWRVWIQNIQSTIPLKVVTVWFLIHKIHQNSTCLVPRILKHHGLPPEPWPAPWSEMPLFQAVFVKPKRPRGVSRRFGGSQPGGRHILKGLILKLTYIISHSSFGHRWAHRYWNDWKVSWEWSESVCSWLVKCS